MSNTLAVQPIIEPILKKIEQAERMYHRLVLVVFPSGSGKTSALYFVREQVDSELKNINLELSRRMLDLTERQRALQLPRLMAEIVNTPQCRVVLLDNIELLFDVSLKQDPLRILQNLSRNRTLVVAWNGYCEGSHLIYAAPGHPEYRRYAMADILVVDNQMLA